MTQLRWPRQGPWDEAFFLEWIDDSGVGWWFRWTLTDGVRPRIGVWAMREGGDHHTALCRELPLSTLQAAPGGWIAGEGFWLGPQRAVGDAGAISWDLHLSSPDPVWRAVPLALETLRLGRTYEPAVPAMQIVGTVTVDGITSTARGRGTLGHLFGARNRVARWAWTHASLPDDDTVFEALSAQIGSTSAHPMTSVHLRVGMQSWTLSGLIDVVRARADLSREQLVLRAIRGDVRIEATMTLPPDPIEVRYEDPTGATSTCRNSTRCALAVRVIDRGRGIDHAFRTDRAIGEVGTRDGG